MCNNFRVLLHDDLSIPVSINQLIIIFHYGIFIIQISKNNETHYQIKHASSLEKINLDFYV